MAVIKNKTTDASQEYWSHIEEVADEVRKWPDWMGNDKKEISGEPKPEATRVLAAKAGSGKSGDTY